MSDIKIIVGVCCTYCRGAVSYDGSDNGIKAGRLDPRSYGYCLNCNRKSIFEGSFETELLEDKSEVKSEAIKEVKGIELKSPYHRINTLKHKDQIDFYDIINLLENNGHKIPVEIAHGLKKLMYDDRGHKNPVQDKKEAVWSINRWIEENESD
jgi:hypothetical protein